jgi:hypothetical protein
VLHAGTLLFARAIEQTEAHQYGAYQGETNKRVFFHFFEIF